ncbi:MAG: hypothetical protein ACREQ5_39025 [Candidatus Dormibacteria bacterium]
MTALAVVSLVGALGAFACTALATLEVQASAVAVGAPVHMVGSGFGQASPWAQLRWNAANGPVLWSGHADGAGNLAGLVSAAAHQVTGRLGIVRRCRAQVRIPGLPELCLYVARGPRNGPPRPPAGASSWRRPPSLSG